MDLEEVVHITMITVHQVNFSELDMKTVVCQDTENCPHIECHIMRMMIQEKDAILLEKLLCKRLMNGVIHGCDQSHLVGVLLDVETEEGVLEEIVATVVTLHIHRRGNEKNIKIKIKF